MQDVVKRVREIELVGSRVIGIFWPGHQFKLVFKRKPVKAVKFRWNRVAGVLLDEEHGCPQGCTTIAINNRDKYVLDQDIFRPTEGGDKILDVWRKLMTNVRGGFGRGKSKKTFKGYDAPMAVQLLRSTECPLGEQYKEFASDSANAILEQLWGADFLDAGSDDDCSDSEPCAGVAASGSAEPGPSVAAGVRKPKVKTVAIRAFVEVEKAIQSARLIMNRASTPASALKLKESTIVAARIALAAALLSPSIVNPVEGNTIAVAAKTDTLNQITTQNCFVEMFYSTWVAFAKGVGGTSDKELDATQV